MPGLKRQRAAPRRQRHRPLKHRSGWREYIMDSNNFPRLRNEFRSLATGERVLSEAGLRSSCGETGPTQCGGRYAIRPRLVREAFLLLGTNAEG